jgi:hypothetical protein
VQEPWISQDLDLFTPYYWLKLPVEIRSCFSHSILYIINNCTYFLCHLKWEDKLSITYSCPYLAIHNNYWDPQDVRFNWQHLLSEGQEKYLREPSITPVGYFTGAIENHSRVVSHRNYFAWRKLGISEEQEWFSQG